MATLWNKENHLQLEHGIPILHKGRGREEQRGKIVQGGTGNTSHFSRQRHKEVHSLIERKEEQSTSLYLPGEKIK